jgi:hypothetical protein
MSDLELLKQMVDVNGGFKEAAAYAPLADELSMLGHPRGEELCELAQIITGDDSHFAVAQAMALFDAFMKLD